MLLPKAFQPSVEDDYWHLRKHVQIWDVACQRQVQITGPDAAKLVQWLTPRDLSCALPGQCLYVPLTDEHGGLINDPVLLKLAEDRFWLSIADSDVLLWAKGLALGAGLIVSVTEPDVSPLAIQGPRAEDLLADLFGEEIRRIGFFRFGFVEFHGQRQLIARSGYSRQGGFEIYLKGSAYGPALWDAIWQAGVPYQIRPGCPNLIERIEGGLLSYGNEMTRENNPLECAMERFCQLKGPHDFIGQKALCEIEERGIERQIRGVTFNGGACPVCSEPWPVMAGHGEIGRMTSAIWSPRLKANVGLAMIDRPYWQPGTAVTIQSADGMERAGSISALPLGT